MGNNEYLDVNYTIKKTMIKITLNLFILIATFSASLNMQAQNSVSYVNTKTNDFSNFKGNNRNSKKAKPEAAEKVNYDLWEVLLKKNVSATGTVNYEGFRKDSDKFNDFLRQLSRVKITTTWTKTEKMAYWINVYNAYTIKLIVNNFPVASIKEIDGPWKKKFFTVDGKVMSLGEVEHQILRGFGDPRIHFAINCASASCPRLIQVPYRASNLERLLERQTKEFINDPFYNTITNYSVNVSKLFDWYKKDFKEDSGSVVNFINKYSDVNIGPQKNKGYKTYDWSINALRN